MKQNQTVATVIVTYNRLELLKRCLIALSKQKISPTSILVVDNASIDETRTWLSEWLPKNLPSAELIALPDNRGGAGGFSEGLRVAIDRGSDWVWMMDDDAEPHPDALAELMETADDPSNVYSSLATKGTETSWTTTLLDPTIHVTNRIADVPSKARVQSLPFLGFLIHRKLVMKVGLPDTEYFIAADDVEYCKRVERAGAQLFIAGRSHIEHPKADYHEVQLLGHTLTCLRLAPWKRYYDTRNRLLIAREYYGIRLFTQTIPGSLVRLFVVLIKEPRKFAQIWAFTAGMVDGLIGLKGKRHVKWGIPQ